MYNCKPFITAPIHPLHCLHRGLHGSVYTQNHLLHDPEPSYIHVYVYAPRYWHVAKNVVTCINIMRVRRDRVDEATTYQHNKVVNNNTASGNVVYYTRLVTCAHEINYVRVRINKILQRIYFVFYRAIIIIILFSTVDDQNSSVHTHF